MLNFFLGIKAQVNYLVGYLPAVNISTKLNDLGSLNFNVQQRNSLINSDENKLNHQYVLSDLTVMYGYKVGLYAKASVGGLIRYRNNQLITRTIQQFVSVKQIDKLKLVNRLRLDQTYLPTLIEHRLRYRVGLQIPLNGTEVDNRELYLKINNEYLNSYAEQKYDLEARLTSSLGYVMNNKNKLEAGFDYRLDNLITQPITHTFWVTISLYVNLK
jgi:hypothetical protein